MYRQYRLAAEARRLVLWVGSADDPLAVGDRLTLDDGTDTEWTVLSVGGRGLEYPRAPYYDAVTVARAE